MKEMILKPHRVGGTNCFFIPKKLMTINLEEDYRIFIEEVNER